MKNKKYLVKGTPIIASLCGILLAVLWYLFFCETNGEWYFEFNTLSFSEMSSWDLTYTILTLTVPIVFFIVVLFLVELSPRWALLAFVPSIALQLFLNWSLASQDVPDYIFEHPVQFVAPFLGLILFALTVEKVIPTKWVFVGFCGVAVLVPLVMMLLKTGEFVYKQDGYDAFYQIITYVVRYWSDYLFYALLYVGFGFLGAKMSLADGDLSEESAEDSVAESDSFNDAEEDDQP